MNYLVFGTHSIIHLEMKSFKSLEAHNYYLGDSVNNHVYVKILEDGRILMPGKVSDFFLLLLFLNECVG